MLQHVRVPLYSPRASEEGHSKGAQGEALDHLSPVYSCPESVSGFRTGFSMTILLLTVYSSLLTVDKGVGIIFPRYPALSRAYQFILNTNDYK